MLAERCRLVLYRQVHLSVVADLSEPWAEGRWTAEVVSGHAHRAVNVGVAREEHLRVHLLAGVVVGANLYGLVPGELEGVVADDALCRAALGEHGELAEAAIGVHQLVHRVGREDALVVTGAERAIEDAALREVVSRAGAGRAAGSRVVRDGEGILRDLRLHGPAGACLRDDANSGQEHALAPEHVAEAAA